MWVFFFRIGSWPGIDRLGGLSAYTQKKKWQEIQGDAFMPSFFITIWGFIYYLIIA